MWIRHSHVCPRWTSRREKRWRSCKATAPGQLAPITVAYARRPAGRTRPAYLFKFQMSTSSSHLSPTRFQITTYLPFTGTHCLCGPGASRLNNAADLPRGVGTELSHVQRRQRNVPDARFGHAGNGLLVRRAPAGCPRQAAASSRCRYTARPRPRHSPVRRDRPGRVVGVDLGLQVAGGQHRAAAG